MTAADLGAVAAIEASAFTDPWSPEQLAAELENPVARVWVAEGSEGTLLGHISVWIIPDEMEILDVAVSPAARRQGTGRALVQHAIQAARTADCRTAFLEVRRSNVAALALYEGLGFHPVAIRAGYYRAGNEDALVLRLVIA